MLTHPWQAARCRFHLLSLLLLPLCCTSWAASEFYVATSGHDQAAGTQQDPFATLARAQQAVRQRLREEPQQGVTVRVATGHYELPEPLVFGPEDGGPCADAPVRYQAEVDGQVVLSGGQRIGNWQPADEQPGLWKTRVVGAPAQADMNWRFEQLWVNGRRAVRARSPGSWEFHLLAANVLEEPTDQRGRYQHTFPARPGDLRVLGGLSAQQLQDVQVLVFHKWDTTREWIQAAQVDADGGGTFTTVGGKMKSWNSMTRDCLYFFENFRRALDAPGEWFLARDGWLYYYPRPGEDMQTAEVFAPRINAFLTVQGQVDEPQQWVRNLHFQGLQFRHAEFRIPAAGQPPHQAAMSVADAAILVNGAHNVSFDSCAVEHIGTTAFWFREACRDCRVTRTRMFDLGITGVRIGQEQLVPLPVRTGQISIDNCIIHSGGRIMPCAVGVWIGHSADNALTHCDVADFFYTAVSVGWRWGYGESGAQRNRVEFNHLHHIGYRILSDMGGVYTLGPSPGTSVSHNVIHDVYSTRYGGWGLYPDEGSTGILFENNLVYDVRDGCFHQHYGKENMVRNNILAFSEEGQIAVSRAEPHLSFTLERNLVYWDNGRLLGYRGWNAGAQVKLQHNLYWRAGGQPFDFAGKSWEQWRAAGQDAGSVIADPLFVDAAGRDFRLREASPALQIGFVPFDYGQAGVYGSEQWQHLARSTEFPDPYVVPQAEPPRATR